MQTSSNKRQETLHVCTGHAQILTHCCATKRTKDTQWKKRQKWQRSFSLFNLNSVSCYCMSIDLIVPHYSTKRHTMWPSLYKFLSFITRTFLLLSHLNEVLKEFIVTDSTFFYKNNHVSMCEWMKRERGLDS